MAALGVDVLTPVDQFLAEQADLTAVERFSRAHDSGALRLGGLEPVGGPTSRYRHLMPATPPGPGEQYAFDVDLDACSGCKACVTACHSLNGLDADESFRKVGLVHGTVDGSAFQQTVTHACHHCVDPACLNGCPSLAYEKDPFTGIVRHLDDQCIGCGYCTFTCPYEVPQLNHRLGIVRKCDLCSDRLAEGEAPACVQACPSEAISVALVNTAAVTATARPSGSSAVAVLAAPAEASLTHGAPVATPVRGWSTDAPERLVSGAPLSSLTVPTTRYRSASPTPPDARAADRFAVAPAHAHSPLATMLVLTQVSVGALLASTAVDLVAPANVAQALQPVSAAITLGAGLTALAASLGHLGRPMQAWRAVLGLRRSWLSREIVAVAAFAALAAAHAAATVLDFGESSRQATAWAAAVAGMAAVGSSIMIYAVTGRRWWSGPLTAARFAGTTVAGGLSTLLVAGAAVAGSDGAAPGVRALMAVVAVLSTVVVLGRLGWERGFERRWRGRGLDDEVARSVLLCRRDLRHVRAWRAVAAVVGSALLPWVVVADSSGRPGPATVVVAVLAAAAVLAGELAERRLFFQASSPTGMPGAFR